MGIASYTQFTHEVKIYQVDYGSASNTTPWLSTSESLSGTPTVTVTPTTSPALSISAITKTSANTVVTFTASGGTAGTKYKLVIKVDTTFGQTKEVVEHITVKAAN